MPKVDPQILAWLKSKETLALGELAALAQAVGLPPNVADSLTRSSWSRAEVLDLFAKYGIETGEEEHA